MRWVGMLSLVSILESFGGGDSLAQEASISDRHRSPVFVSYDQGRRWQSVGAGVLPPAQASFLRRLGGQIVLATDDAGLFMSELPAASWLQIGAALPGRKISALEVSGNEIYVSVFRHGAFVSDDRGQHWRVLDEAFKDRTVQSILKRERDLFLGVDSGIFRKRVGEGGWIKVFQGPQVVSLIPLQNRVIAASVGGVLRSDESATGWDWVHREGALHGLTVQGNDVFALYISGDLFVSRDQGLTWFELEYAPRHGSYIYGLSRAGSESGYVMSNNYGVHRSKDGQNWQLEVAQEDLAFFDFLVYEDRLYAGARTWQERRGRSLLGVEYPN